MTAIKGEQEQLKTLIRQYIDDENKVERLVDYLSRHEIIDLDFFSFLGFDKMNKYMFQPVKKEVFIRRIPFYFHRSQKNNLDDLGTVYDFVCRVNRVNEFSSESYEEELEHFFFH